MQSSPVSFDRLAWHTSNQIMRDYAIVCIEYLLEFSLTTLGGEVLYGNQT